MLQKELLIIHQRKRIIVRINKIIMSREAHHTMIVAMNKCVIDCNHCATVCLKKKVVSSITHCIQLDLDYEDICNLKAAYSTRGSEYAMLAQRNAKNSLIVTRALQKVCGSMPSLCAGMSLYCLTRFKEVQVNLCFLEITFLSSKSIKRFY